MDEDGRKRLQRDARNKQLGPIELWLADASRMIEDSKREVERSRGLLWDRREQDARDDRADDVATG